MKIDLHVHINRTSKCARQEPEEMALKAKEKGLSGIVILDHHYYPNDEECKKAEEISGIKIFKGIEITIKTEHGSNDIVCISPNPPDFDYGAFRKPIPENRMEQLLLWLHNSKGLSILAHPFRKDKPIFIDLKKYPVNCIEIASKNTHSKNRLKILKTALNYNIVPVSTSDAHKTKSIGNHCIQLDFSVYNETDLAAMIIQRRFQCLEKRLAPIILPNL